MRAVQCLELLGKHHRVTLLAPEPVAGQPPPPEGFEVGLYRRSSWPVHPKGVGLSLRQGFPLQSALFYQPDLASKLRALGPASDLVILQTARLAGHMEDLSGVPVAVDLIDSLALNFSRRAELESPLRRSLFRHEASRLVRCEAEILRRALGALVVCERDRDAMATTAAGPLVEKLSVLPLAFPLRSGDSVDEPVSGGGAPKVAAPILALTGNLGYFPTVEGFSWWLAEVWPRLHRARPEIEVIVAGARPARRLRRAAERALGKVRLLSSPADLRSILADATLALAPLRSGSGQPLKILEAWQVGVPVVASPWAAAGTRAVSGEALEVASSAELWLSTTLRLLDDPIARARLVEAGRRRLGQDYGRSTVAAAWRDWVESLIS